MNASEPIRVLVAEDDYLVGEMVRSLLEREGYEVVGEASGGDEAVKLTREIQPDVVIMDIEMPGGNGLDACGQIQEVCPTPVVILTAYGDDELLRRAGQKGAGAYLIKPPRERDLDRAITIAMARFDDLRKLRKLNEQLQQALREVRTLSGLLPICAACKKIRDDEGYWHDVEEYISSHSDTEFSHGICPDCSKRLYPTYHQKLQQVPPSSGDGPGPEQT